MKNKWVVFMAVFLSSIAAAMNQFKVPPVLVDLMKELNLDMVVGGMIMSSYSLAVIILVFPGAFILNRFGVKKTGLLALGCGLIGSLLGAVSTSLNAISAL